MNVREHYRRLRRENEWLSARRAIEWARHEAAVDRVYMEVETTDEYHVPGRIGTITHPDGWAIVVWLDDEAYDWGDLEPTERERDGMVAYGIGVRLADDDDTEMLDVVWNVGIMDDQDVEREALSFALNSCYPQRAMEEMRERCEWAARDTVTL